MNKTLTKKVVPIKEVGPSGYQLFKDAPLYLKPFVENKPPPPPKCFLGAWYRKVYSAKDNWLGIEGVITLGEFNPDEKRFASDGRVIYERYLDNPSVYMGGQALSESDAGLGFNYGYLTTNTLEKLNYGSPKFTYRPFWRYIYSEVIDVDGNVTRNNVNSWNVTDAKDFNYYYFPGDTIKMSVYSPEKNYLQLRIELLKPSTIPKYKKIRDGYGLKEIKVFYSPLFYSEGHGAVDAEFKRVNSIDQYGNEGFIVKETSATVTEAVWENTYLFKKIDGTIYRVPFTKNRRTEMACPNSESFTIKDLTDGGEVVTIHPKYDL